MNNGFVQSVSMVILMQPDLDAAVAFYNELGLKLQFRMKDKWAEFDLNGVKIGLCPASGPVQESRTGIVLHCADVAQAYSSLKDSLIFLSEPVAATHGIMVSIKDPGGNILDLYQPTPEKLKETLRQTYEQASGCCKDEQQQATRCTKKKINSCC